MAGYINKSIIRILKPAVPALVILLFLCVKLNIISFPGYGNIDRHELDDEVDKMEQEEIESTCDKDAVLCGMRNVQQQNLNDVKATFHRLITTKTFSCSSRKRFGKQGDGGYEVCMLEKFAPISNSCLVYSFGIRDDWSFDEHISKYGCETHSFDPSLPLEDHIHPPNVSFHKLGIWGDDYINSHNWQLNRLSTIREKLGHKSRVIDVLKMDVEIAEWPFLRDVTQKELESLGMIKQLLIEYHTPVFKIQNVTTDQMTEVTQYVKKLKDLGFEMFQFTNRNYCCGKFARWVPSGVVERCCIESFYVNTKYS